MPGPGEVPEHPAVKTLDKMGAAFAAHVQAQRQAGAAEESADRREFVTGLVQGLGEEIKPALRDALAGAVASLPAEHPLRKTLELFGSPAVPWQEWLLDILGIFFIAKDVLGDVGTVQSQGLLNKLWANNAELPLSPVDAANMVVQGIVAQVQGEGFAALTGLSAANFDLLVEVTGMPPSPQDLFAMFRRGIIGMTATVEGQLSVVQGIQQGHTKDMWLDAFSQLAYTWPMPVEFVNAAVREQVPYTVAAEWAAKAGLDVTTEVADGMTFFDLMFDVAGRPPGPEMAARMAHRGIIPWEGSGPAAVTFQQAIAESDLKTKWTDALRIESAYVPPGSEVKQLYLHGAIDHAQAVTYLGMSGVDPDLAGAILYLAEQEYVAQDKALAKADIQTMYVMGEIDYSDALAQLDVIGFRGAVGEWILELANVKREQRILQRSVTKVTNEVVKGFLAPSVGAATLAGMGVAAAQVEWLTAEWDWQRTLERKQPSASQVAKAYQYAALTEPEAMAYLAWLGYAPFDAYIVLAAESESVPPVKPAMPALPAPWPPQDSAGNVIYPATAAGHSQPLPPFGQSPPVPGIVSPPPPFPAAQ